MAHANENTSEEWDFEGSTDSDKENTSSAFEDMLRSYRSVSEALHRAIQGSQPSDALQRAAGLSTANSAAEQFAKHHQSLTGISDNIKKLEPPQLAPLALKASAEISQQLKALFELQKSLIPSSATIAAATRLVSASDRTQKILEWMSTSSDVKGLIESLDKPKDILSPSQISPFRSATEHILSAQKLMGAGIVGMMNNIDKLSVDIPTTDKEPQ